MKSKVSEAEWKRRIKPLIPFAAQKLIYGLVKKLRLAKNLLKKEISKEDLKKCLSNAGLVRGDTVIVHSSLGRIGFINGGASSLIDALLESLGKEGILVMPAFSAPAYDAKRGTYIFDVNCTPAYTGTIPETFRLREGVKRSLSPMHSVAAYGNKAEWLVKGHEECDNPYSMKGPFGKLYKLDAKIFLIGVDQLANSSIHIVEDKCKFPIGVFTKKMKAVVTDEKGGKKIIYFRNHLPHLHKIRNNNIIEKYLLEDGSMRIFQFGDTELRALKARDLVRVMENLLKKGITIYGKLNH